MSAASRSSAGERDGAARQITAQKNEDPTHVPQMSTALAYSLWNQIRRGFAGSAATPL
jgi:hypothetical protein